MVFDEISMKAHAGRENSVSNLVGQCGLNLIVLAHGFFKKALYLMLWPTAHKL